MVSSIKSRHLSSTWLFSGSFRLNKSLPLLDSEQLVEYRVSAANGANPTVVVRLLLTYVHML